LPIKPIDKTIQKDYTNLTETKRSEQGHTTMATYRITFTNVTLVYTDLLPKNMSTDYYTVTRPLVNIARCERDLIGDIQYNTDNGLNVTNLEIKQDGDWVVMSGWEAYVKQVVENWAQAKAEYDNE
jgi:hypothetical protein